MMRLEETLITKLIKIHHIDNARDKGVHYYLCFVSVSVQPTTLSVFISVLRSGWWLDRNRAGRMEIVNLSLKLL